MRSLGAGQNYDGKTAEPPKPAKTPDAEDIILMEKLIATADTAQQRCYAGFFAYLAHNSARGADGQRSRNMRLTVDALVGENRMKNKRAWTKWFACRKGISASDWASDWFDQLRAAGLPGSDFVLAACNTAADKWLNRPAQTEDIQRVLHHLLLLYSGKALEQVLQYTVHGFRHYYIVAGSQLKLQGLVSSDRLNSLGHWEAGSKMPVA